MTQNAPAGWYADPENPAQQRYWDGAVWAQTVVSNPPTGFSPHDLASPDAPPGDDPEQSPESTGAPMPGSTGTIMTPALKMLIEILLWPLVAAVNTVVAYVLLLAVLQIMRGPLPANYYLVAQWTAWILMVPFVTATMKYIVFWARGPYLGQLARTCLVVLLTQGLSKITWLTVNLLSPPSTTGNVCAIALVWIVSFVGFKYFVFRKSTLGRQYLYRVSVESKAIG